MQEQNVIASDRRGLSPILAFFFAACLSVISLNEVRCETDKKVELIRQFRVCVGLSGGAGRDTHTRTFHDA